MAGSAAQVAVEHRGKRSRYNGAKWDERSRCGGTTRVGASERGQRASFKRGNNRSEIALAVIVFSTLSSVKERGSHGALRSQQSTIDHSAPGVEAMTRLRKAIAPTHH